VRFRVSPNARQTALIGLMEISGGQTAFKVSLKDPPEDGKANKALIQLIAKSWKIPKSTLTIKSGDTSRIKTVLIEGDTAALKTTVLNYARDLNTDI
jgi:uncharacterized protein (TIGR00251 family)